MMYCNGDLDTDMLMCILWSISNLMHKLDKRKICVKNQYIWWMLIADISQKQLYADSKFESILNAPEYI